MKTRAERIEELARKFTDITEAEARLDSIGYLLDLSVGTEGLSPESKEEKVSSNLEGIAAVCQYHGLESAGLIYFERLYDELRVLKQKERQFQEIPAIHKVLKRSINATPEKRKLTFRELNTIVREEFFGIPADTPMPSSNLNPDNIARNTGYSRNIDNRRTYAQRVKMGKTHS